MIAIAQAPAQVTTASLSPVATPEPSEEAGLPSIRAHELDTVRREQASVPSGGQETTAASEPTEKKSTVSPELIERAVAQFEQMSPESKKGAITSVRMRIGEAAPEIEAAFGKFLDALPFDEVVDLQVSWWRKGLWPDATDAEWENIRPQMRQSVAQGLLVGEGIERSSELHSKKDRTADEELQLQTLDTVIERNWHSAEKHDALTFKSDDERNIYFRAINVSLNSSASGLIKVDATSEAPERQTAYGGASAYGETSTLQNRKYDLEF